jgi:hypothetical protein
MCTRCGLVLRAMSNLAWAFRIPTAKPQQTSANLIAATAFQQYITDHAVTMRQRRRRRQVRCRAEMEDETEPLLKRADMLWREGRLHDTDRLYGHQRATLEQVDF